jgi:hypothetical protein
MAIQAEKTAPFLEHHRAFQQRMKAEAAAKAKSLIQGYLGPDNRVQNIQTFCAALTEALCNAREQGQIDGSGDLLTF